MPSAAADPSRPASVANTALDSVGLTALMERTAGRPSVTVALVDGPLAPDVPALEGRSIRGATPDDPAGAPVRRARAHAVRVAAILVGSRTGPVPGICPDCTLAVHPVLEDRGDPAVPRATHEELADALLAAVDAGADVVNVSLGLQGRSPDGERRVEEALGRAAERGVLVVAAAGNESRLGGSVLTRHPWVVPVAAYGRDGAPLGGAHLGHSLGVRGLGAPGEDVPTLRRSGRPARATGTSFAAPIVSGAAALLWSAFPDAPATEVRQALVGSPGRRRSTVPPLLDADAAYRRMESAA